MIKQSLLNTHELSILVALLVASGFFATLVYFMFGKKTDYVLFICYSLLSAFALSFLLNGNTRLFILFYTSASFSLFIFFAHYFLQRTSYKRPIFLFSYLILLLIFTLLFLLKNENILLLTAWLIHEFFIILSLYLSINAIQRKVNSAKKIFLLIGLSFIFKYLFISTSFLLTSISVSIAIILFTLTYIIILDIRTQNKLVKNLKVRMIQLENEMLKKTDSTALFTKYVNHS